MAHLLKLKILILNNNKFCNEKIVLGLVEIIKRR